MFFVNHISCLCAWCLNPGEFEFALENGQRTLGRLELGFIDNEGNRVELCPPFRDLLTRPLSAVMAATGNEKASCPLKELLASFSTECHGQMLHCERLLDGPLVTSLQMSQVA